MSENTQRRLTTIVAADIAGFSRLVGIDEEATLAAQRQHRAELIEPLLAEHHGRIANTAGDSFLLEFPSAVEAVRCSLAVQNGMAERNHEIAAERRIEYRIGINVGDVVADGDDLLGDGVNIAARLENLCTPGGIILSDDAYRQVRDRLEIDWEDGGEHEVKNIARPMQIWQWKSNTVVNPANSEVALSQPDKPSIAILPFANMSGDPQQEYFSDGLTEDIITGLSRLRWLFVIARNSSFTYKGLAIDIKQVGQELGVRYVLEGSVRKAGGRCRVTAQLIETEIGSHIWAERYDRELTDIFDLQDEITSAIIGTLPTDLYEAEVNRAIRKTTENLDAWDHFQLGRQQLAIGTKDATEQADKHFAQALEFDPGFSHALALRAEILSNKVVFGFTEDIGEALERALEMGRRAALLDGNDSDTHMIYGRILAEVGQHENAIAELTRALRLDPNHAWGYFYLGFALYWSGQAAEALPHLQNCLRLSPRDPFRGLIEYIIGSIFTALGDKPAAMQCFQNALHYPASEFQARLGIVNCLVSQDKLSEAAEALQEVLAVQPELTVRTIEKRIGHLHEAYKTSYLNNLRMAGMPE